MRNKIIDYFCASSIQNMKLENASISILINEHGTRIEVRDKKSATNFLEIKLTPEQLNSCLSRRGDVECEVQIVGVDKLNKKHENKYYEFRIPGTLPNQELVKICNESLARDGMGEWVPDEYFQSQNSFFSENGQRYARAVIRRWI